VRGRQLRATDPTVKEATMAVNIPLDDDFQELTETIMRNIKLALGEAFRLGCELGQKWVCENPDDYDLQPKK